MIHVKKYYVQIPLIPNGLLVCDKTEFNIRPAIGELWSMKETPRLLIFYPITFYYKHLKE
jgi:hypothetical protein